MLDNPSRLQSPGYQPFAVLSMCRAVHTLSTGLLVSKSEAVTWAVASLAEEWIGLIQQAIKWGEGDGTESIEETLNFLHYAIDLCRKN
jgi:hypothetical protein